MDDLVSENGNSSDDSEDDSLSADSGDENAPAARVRALVSDNDWTDERLHDCGPTMLQFLSQGSSGPANLENCCRAIDYFNLFFTSEIVQDIVDEVNRYAKEKISNGNFKPASRLRQWRATNTEEFMIFLGILMNVGIVRILSVQMYWTTKWTENVPFFRDSISCNRFLLLYHTTLHVCHTNPNTNSDRAHKITPLLEKLVHNFQHHYIPFQELSVNESMIGYKGRVAFRMYCPKKPSEWGLLMRTAACSHTDYLLNAVLYSGRNVNQNLEEGISKTGQAFIGAVSPFANRGHHIYCDRLYSSVALVENLYRNGFHYTGTIQLNRVGIPKKAKNVRGMRPGDISAFRRNNVLLLNWRDKRIVSMISTYNKGDEMVPVNMRARTDPVIKPIAVLDYNKHMSGVDLHDQLNKYYESSRKSVKWWKKVFFWILESCITNAWISRRLHTTGDNRKMTLLKFKEELIEDLVSSEDLETPRKKGRPLQGPPLQRLNGRFHSMNQRENQTRDCRVCSDRQHRQRRESKYYCETCTDKPSLHPGQCFTKYHTRQNFR